MSDQPAAGVDRLLGWMIALCGILAVMAAWQRVPAQTPDFAGWWSTGAFAAIGMLVLLVAFERLLSIAQLRGAWSFFILLVLVLQSTVFISYRGADPDALRPWVWTLELPAMCLLPLLFGSAAAVSVATVLPAALVVSGLVVHGHVPATVLQMAPIHLGNIAVLLVVIVLRRRLLSVAHAQHRRGEADVRRIRAQSRLRRQQEVARLVHDDVLSALTAAMRLPGPSHPEVRRAARNGLAALRAAVQSTPLWRPREMTAPAVRRMLMETAEAHGAPGAASITVHPGTVPAEVAQRSSKALAEALRNSGLHAPGDRATVSGEVGGDSVRITVADRGPGFDPASSTSERLGVRMSILARMRSLPGGIAEILSGPDGTTVEVGWRRSAETVVDTGLSSPLARVALTFVWVTGILHGLAVGGIIVRAPGIAALSYAIALAGVLLATCSFPGRLPRSRAWAAASCAVALVLGVIGYLDVTGARADEYWLITFAGYLLSVVIARGNPIVGGISTAVIVTWIGLWAIGTQQRTDGFAAMVTPMLISAVAGMVWLFGVTAIARRQEGLIASAHRAVAMTSAAASARWASRRELREILSETEPTLNLIASGADIDQAAVREIETVEGGIRDRIRAADLYWPTLARAVAAARRRGTQVLLLGDDSSTGRISEPAAMAVAALMADESACSITVRAFGGDVSVVIEHTDGSRERTVIDARAPGAQNGQMSGT